MNDVPPRGFYEIVIDLLERGQLSRTDADCYLSIINSGRNVHKYGGAPDEIKVYRYMASILTRYVETQHLWINIMSESNRNILWFWLKTTGLYTPLTEWHR